MNTRRWVIQKTNEEKCAVLCRELGILPITAKLLYIRGFDTPEKARGFISREHVELHDPFLLKDMDKAVLRIKQAINKKEKICIYGDYDVDGVTATTLLYTYLTEKGADCIYFIPERVTEGYGLSTPVIKRLADEVDLLITVDTGITAVAEADYAKRLGIDMIITDHHSCRDQLPDAIAVVNPQREDCGYPFRQLAGVGVVFKLLCALDGDTEQICDRYAEIAAIGTIADVMPIIDENRYISIMGLKRLEKTDYPGLKALMKHSGVIKNGKTKKIGSSVIGYVLAPRINAAGRIASASMAVELLLSRSDKEADHIAAELCEINKIRQETEQKIYLEALEMISDVNERDKFFVLGSADWHQGVIGVVASKISEKYSLPCILFSVSDGIGKGSGRSIQGFSLMDALSACSDLLIEYGGHELAAGLTIAEENIDRFRTKINEYAKKHIPETESVLSVDVDCEVDFDEINLKSIEEIQLLEPFGLKNPVPMFVMRSVVVSEITALSGGKHVRLKLRPHSQSARSEELSAIYFSIPQNGFRLFPGDVCDIFFSADINEYMGKRSPQLLIRAVKLVEKRSKEAERENILYEKICDENNHESLPEYVMPTLNDFRAVFRFLKRELDSRDKKMSVGVLCKQLKAQENYEINSCKVRIIFDVLRQENLVKLSDLGNGDAFEIEFLPAKKKINLDNNRLLKSIKKKHSLYSDNREKV